METCIDCQGTGTVERQRSRWIGGGQTGYRSEWTVAMPCEACQGAGVMPEPDPPTGAGKGMIQVSSFEIDNNLVNAPGLEREQFVAFVDRAKAAQLRTTPAGTPGTVLVLSGSSDVRYQVTRGSCECIGHQRVGRCWHRAYAIWLVDVAGVDITTVPTIGVSRRSLPLTTGRRVVA
jgi:hypothetical protein